MKSIHDARRGTRAHTVTARTEINAQRRQQRCTAAAYGGMLAAPSANAGSAAPPSPSDDGGVAAHAARVDVGVLQHRDGGAARRRGVAGRGERARPVLVAREGVAVPRVHGDEEKRLVALFRRRQRAATRRERWILGRVAPAAPAKTVPSATPSSSRRWSGNHEKSSAARWGGGARGGRGVDAEHVPRLLQVHHPHPEPEAHHVHVRARPHRRRTPLRVEKEGLDGGTHPAAIECDVEEAGGVAADGEERAGARLVLLVRLVERREVRHVVEARPRLRAAGSAAARCCRRRRRRCPRRRRRRERPCRPPRPARSRWPACSAAASPSGAPTPSRLAARSARRRSPCTRPPAQSCPPRPAARR